MADYSSVAPPSSNAGGGMNDAFKDALQRARQVGRLITHEAFSLFSKSELKIRLSQLTVLTNGIMAG